VIPLFLFLLGCVTIYVGAVQVAFSVLMRLPLRLSAERHGRLEALGHYLEEPLRLFVPVRLLQAVLVSAVTLVGVSLLERPEVGLLGLILFGVVLFVLVFSHVLPLLIVRRDPEQVLGVLLPSFHLIVKTLCPITDLLIGLLSAARRERVDTGPSSKFSESNDAKSEAVTSGDQVEAAERAERKLLQSVVDFGDTLVREVMTPRPDIVAVQSDATLSDLQATFGEEQYSRILVYKENLDNILGFVFVKDLVLLTGVSGDERVVERLMRPAYIVPETKRVAELLKEFQHAQVQSAIVHDEYGGTAGLVTIEDLLEEIVGEIRDEYDVETEPVVDEGNGSFLFSGSVSVDDLTEHLNVEIERHGFETVGGYLLSRLGRVPRSGEMFDVDQFSVEVLEVERRRVRRVRLRRRLESSAVEAKL
jgi:putative hemolysin